MAVSGLIGSLRELAGRFASDAFGFGVGQAISTALEPEATELAQEAWDLLPIRALDPADLANMAVQGVMSEADAAVEAQKAGFNSDRFHRLFLVNGSPIAPEQALDLWNRGEISEADVDRALLQSRLKPEWVETFKLLRRQLVQLADLAEMVVQNVLDRDQAAARAAMLGIAGDDFDRIVRLAGNPPGPQELLTMWNRGMIDETEATLGLHQSRLKQEWVERFKLLRTVPASLSAAVNAVVKERIPMERGAAIARENGVDAETFAMLVDEAGRPISITEGLQLLRRDKIDQARFREIVARSDVKTEFTADLLGLQEVLPSLAQMRAIIGTGAIDDKVSRSILHRLGLADDVVEGIIAAGHGVKLEGTKQLTQSAVLDAYQSMQIDKATATTMLQGLGYDTNDAGVLLAYTDFQRTKAYRNAVIGVVKARYLAHDIDETTASGMLDAIGMPSPERDQFLQLWTFDIQANPHLLTLAQLNALVKAGLYTPEQYAAYLPRLGYVEPELTALVALYAGGPRP